MAESWNKKEREKKKQQKKKEKKEMMLDRKEHAKDGKSFNDMIAYIDENGNFTSTPPDPRNRIEINAEDIEIGIPKQADIDPADLIRTGIVSFYNDSKGFGFINDLQTQERIFVHVNALIDPIKENNKVSFEVERGPKGLNAVNVKLVK